MVRHAAAPRIHLGACDDQGHAFFF